MKKLKKLLLLLVIILLPIAVKAEGTVEEIRIDSETTSAVVGALPSFTVSTLSEHISVEAYGSNTGWSKWESGMSSWHGFGTETPTAVAGETHYALRLSVQLDEGYTFGDNVTIYFNGTDVTSEGHTELDTGFDWGGYLYIDLGAAKVKHTLTFVTNGGTPIEPQLIDDGNYFIPGFVETTKNGYNFGGWFLDAALTEEYNTNYGMPAPITKDTTFYARWIDENEATITAVNVTIKSPQIGTSVQWNEVETGEGAYIEPSLIPTIVLENGSHVVVGYIAYIKALPSMNVGDYSDGFVGTFEAGKDYYVEVYLRPESGYEFADNVALKVNGGTEYELSDWNSSTQLMFYTKIQAGAENPKVLEGENQTFKANSDQVLTFRFDIDYDEFIASGKVYMDGNLVDPSNYTVSKGSTVITFNTAYTNTLANGNHTLRLTSTNNDVTTSFTVTSSTANPKTGDNILINAIMLLLSGAGLTILKKKKVYE